MYLNSSLLEGKYFLVSTIVRRNVRVEVGVEIRVESWAEMLDWEIQRRLQANFYRNTICYI